jgi:hypothetical protein
LAALTTRDRAGVVHGAGASSTAAGIEEDAGEFGAGRAGVDGTITAPFATRRAPLHG